MFHHVSSEMPFKTITTILLVGDGGAETNGGVQVMGVQKRTCLTM